MAATVVFSLAVVFIYEAFLRSMDGINYCNNYLDAAPWADERMWQAQNELTRFNTLMETPVEDVLTVNNKSFKWTLSRSVLSGVEDAYRLNSETSWHEGRKGTVISRMAYAVYKKDKK